MPPASTISPSSLVPRRSLPLWSAGLKRQTCQRERMAARFRPPIRKATACGSWSREADHGRLTGERGGEGKMSLRVIGTGFGRTGTDSMREALTMLGFGPCHHMSEVMAHAQQKRLWRALAKGAAPDWDRLFAGYKSCVDWPSAH